MTALLVLVLQMQLMKSGTVKDILFDETKFRYSLVDLGFLDFWQEPITNWIFPVLILMMNAFMLLCLTKEQAKNLPEFNDDLKIDYDYEDRVEVSCTPATDTLVNPVAPVAPFDPMTKCTTSLNPALGFSTRYCSEQTSYIAEDRYLQLPERTRVVWN